MTSSSADAAAALVPARRFGPWRQEVRSALELLALTGVAIAQPTLDIVSKDATGVFVSRDASALQVIGFAAIVVLLPTAVLWSVQVAATALFPRARRAIHLGLCVLLVAVITVEVVKKQTGLGPPLLVVVAILAGVGAGLCLWRYQVVRLWLRYLSIAPFIFAGLFLFSSPVTSVVFRQSPEAASGVRVGSPRRVVMVVMDEFPLESLLDGTGHIDASLFPNFAALADGSTWYRNSTTVSPSTESAVPALLTGSYATNRLAAPVASVYPENLFTLLGGAYRMNVHEPFTRLCPKSLCAATPRDGVSSDGMQGMLDDAFSAWTTFASLEPTPEAKAVLRTSLTSDGALGTGTEFIRSLGPHRAGQLDFVHLMLPHSPWQFLGDEQNYEPDRRPLLPGVLTKELRMRDEFGAMTVRQRHLLQVQVVDELLGRIVAKLKRIGAYDESLLVVTADHGAAFTAGENPRGLSETSYPEIMWTPLFVKAPDQHDGTIDDRSVRSVDVLPTIADHLDVALPWEIDGRSALGQPRPPGALRITSTPWDDVPLPPGQDFHTYDGASGFARVLQARAGDGSPRDGLTLYRTGPYGGLVGTRAAPIVATAATGPAASFDGNPDYDHVDPSARKIPWAELRGSVAIPEERRPLAVTVNGVVAGVTETSGLLDRGRTSFAVMLPPELFRHGANEVQLYVVDGPPADPRLVPVRI